MLNCLYITAAKLSIYIRRRLVSIADCLIPGQYLLLEQSRQYWIPYMLKVAIAFNIADIIGDKKVHYTELADINNANHEAMYRLLRALSGEGIFKEVKGKYFKNSKISESLQENHPDTIKHILKHQLYDKSLQMFQILDKAIIKGDSVSEEVFGMEPFKYLQQNPEVNNIYNNAMANSTGILSRAFLKYYSFKKYQTVADIGGGNGMLIKKILKKHTRLKGFLFDLPQVISNIPSDSLDDDIKARLSIIQGDIFEDIPIKADIYLLKNILHAFGDIQCIEILKNIKKNAPENSKVVILEMDLGKMNKRSYGKLFDVFMLMTMGSGMERNSSDYFRLFREAAIKPGKVTKTITPFNIIEGILN
jgi:hypothetical protein